MLLSISHSVSKFLGQIENEWTHFLAELVTGLHDIGLRLVVPLPTLLGIMEFYSEPQPTR